MTGKQKYYAGWDIGGAHLKMALLNTDGAVIEVSQDMTPIWLGLDSLTTTLAKHKKKFENKEILHAVTTTGELADLFNNRQDGVKALVSCFSNVFDHQTTKVFAGKSGFILPSDSERKFEKVASANWCATATFVAKTCQTGILIDIGSTTSDLIPFKDGLLVNCGDSDQQRLGVDELVYTGIVRTPVMAVVNKVPFREKWQHIAAEHFASMSDVYRITSELDESRDLMPTADGEGKTTGHSMRRLARMLGMDYSQNEDDNDLMALAEYVAAQQLELLERALDTVFASMDMTSMPGIIGAGAGRFVAAKLARKNSYPYRDIEELINCDEKQLKKAADCATAVSVARLLCVNT